MYKICYIDVSTFELDSYLEALNKECEVTKLDTSPTYFLKKEIDGVLIFNDDPEKFPEVCKLILKIKNQLNCLIWTISTKQHTISTIVYLQLGVDGNFSDQLSTEEIRLIILNTLKRNKKSKMDRNPADSAFAFFGEKQEKLSVLDSSNRSMIIEGNTQVILTKLEYKIMKLLKDNAGRTVTYKEIYESVWNKPYKNSTYQIANLVFQLRAKIETDTMQPKYIKTVRSIGYQYVE